MGVHIIKKHELHECHSLYNLMVDPAVFPYVRYQCQSFEEYVFVTEQFINQELQGTLISRTIMNDCGHPIGTIQLYDMANETGFLATWIGAPYFGQGYNRRAKESFFAELFLEHQIETVYLKIRKGNIRSKKAVEKLPYVQIANDLNPRIYESINSAQQSYDLYQVKRASFLESRNRIIHCRMTRGWSECRLQRQHAAGEEHSSLHQW